MNYPDGMTAAHFAHIDAIVPSHIQDKGDELDRAKDNVIAAFRAFMSKAGDDLRKLVDAETDANPRNKFPDAELFELMEDRDLFAPVNDWSDIVDLDLAEDYLSAAQVDENRNDQASSEAA